VEQRDVAERLDVEELLRRCRRADDTASVEACGRASQRDLQKVAPCDQCRIPGTLSGLP